MVRHLPTVPVGSCQAVGAGSGHRRRLIEQSWITGRANGPQGELGWGGARKGCIGWEGGVGGWAQAAAVASAANATGSCREKSGVLPPQLERGGAQREGLDDDRDRREGEGVDDEEKGGREGEKVHHIPTGRVAQWV